jgi:hypothetical protein
MTRTQSKTSRPMRKPASPSQLGGVVGVIVCDAELGSTNTGMNLSMNG